MSTSEFIFISFLFKVWDILEIMYKDKKNLEKPYSKVIMANLHFQVAVHITKAMYFMVINFNIEITALKPKKTI